MISGKETREKVGARPEEGTRPVAGKSNKPTETLRSGSLPPAAPVVDAKEDKGACLKCVRQQVGSDGDPAIRPGSPECE